MTNKNKVLSLTTLAAISAILLVSLPGTAFGSAEPLVLTLNPDSFTGDAIPGQVINIDIDLEFPFEAGDQIIGITNIGECDDIGLSGNVPGIFGGETEITVDLEMTISQGAVIRDDTHCKTSFKIFDSGNIFLAVAEFNIWITVNGPLDITPESITLDAVPGQVFMVERTLEFPFEDDDELLGFIEVENCDFEIGLSGFNEPIDGTSNVIINNLTITIASDAEIGSYHCEENLRVVDDGFNVVSNIVLFEIWINVLAPEDNIDGLVEDVVLLDLNNGNTKSLSKKLEQAIKNITNADPTDDAEACEKLQSFIDQLNAFVNAGKITQVQADPLIDVAEALINELCQD